MGFIRSKPKVNIQQMAEIARQKGQDDLARWRAQEAAKEQAVLEAIGEVTDPLANEVLLTVAVLPEAERIQFMHNVFRRLVVQALYKGDALDKEHSEGMKYESVHGYGTGSHGIQQGHANLSRAVIEESLPHFEQPQLGFDDSSS